jgi:hypothetical protein
MSITFSPSNKPKAYVWGHKPHGWLLDLLSGYDIVVIPRRVTPRGLLSLYRFYPQDCVLAIGDGSIGFLSEVIYQFITRKIKTKVYWTDFKNQKLVQLMFVLLITEDTFLLKCATDAGDEKAVVFSSPDRSPTLILTLYTNKPVQVEPPEFPDPEISEMLSQYISQTLQNVQDNPAPNESTISESEQ